MHVANEKQCLCLAQGHTPGKLGPELVWLIAFFWPRGVRARYLRRHSHKLVTSWAGIAATFN